MARDNVLLRIVDAAFALCVATAWVGGAGEQNLAPDPSFEAGARGWQFGSYAAAGNPGASGDVADGVAHTGQRCLHLAGTRSEGQGYWYARGLPVLPGKRTVLMAWVKQRLPLGESYVHLSIGFMDAAGEIIADKDRPFYLGWAWKDFGGADDWLPVGVETVAPPGAVTAGIGLKLVGKGEACFDDVEFSQSDTTPAPTLPPSIGRSTKAMVPAPIAGEATITFSISNPYRALMEDLCLTLPRSSESGIHAEASQPVIVPVGGKVDVPVRVSFPGELMQRDTRLEFQATYRVEATPRSAALIVAVDVMSNVLLSAIRTDHWGRIEGSRAAKDDAPITVLGVTVERGQPEFIAAEDAIKWPGPDANIAVVLRLAGVGPVVGKCSLRCEALDYFWRGEKAEQSLQLEEGAVHLVKLPLSRRQVSRIHQAVTEGGASTFRLRYEGIGPSDQLVSGQADFKVQIPPHPEPTLQPLPERTEEVSPFGKLQLVDLVLCGNPSDPHPFRHGGKGLYTKYSSEPLAYYGGRKLLSYEWWRDYRDNRETFSQITTLLGKPCRTANDWGWFAYKVGRGQLQRGRYYVVVVTYPEDVSRNFLVWNGVDTRASFGWHTGESLGDPFTRQRFMQRVRLPLSGKFEQWTALCRSQVNGSAWVSLHSMGRRADPFQQGIAVESIAVYELGDSDDSGLERLGCEAREPEDAPRRLMGFIEEDARPEAERLLLYRFLGLNFYAPLALSYGGGAYETNSGYILWPSALFGWQGAPLRHPIARSRQQYYRVESDHALRAVLEQARKFNIAVVPVLEYAGTGQLPQEALALLPDQTLHGFHGGTEVGPDGRQRQRFLKDGWCVDMAHPATAADGAALAGELCERYASEFSNFTGVLFAPRFAAWQVSYSPFELSRFARETGVRLPSGSAADRAAWVQHHALDRFMAWHFKKKRETFLAARDALIGARYDLRLFVMNYNTGDDNVPFGSILYFQDKPKGDEFLTPGRVSLPDLSRVDLVRLMENYNRPELACASVGMNPPLYRADKGIVNLAPSHYSFMCGNERYLDSFRTGEGVGVCQWWIYNEDAFLNNASFGWNCPGLHGNEPAGPYCMMDEVLSMATADPIFLAVRIGYFNRGFSEVARAFARAYRALPAVPMPIVAGAAGDREVAVRKARVRDHTYVAVINTGLARDGKTVRLRLPEFRPGVDVLDLGSGEKLMCGHKGLELRLAPMSLRALRVSTRRGT